MDLKTMINSAGLVLTIIGIWVAYRNSPLNFWLIDGGNAPTDHDQQIAKETEKKNRLMAVGIYLVLIGTALQLLGNFVPPGR